VLVSRDDPRRNARVHVGFADAYDRLRADVIAAVEANPDKNVYVFGHSLGGALSMLCAIDLATDRSRGVRSVTHISSGTPRVGNGDFRSLFEFAVPNNLRMTVGLDPVPLIPAGVPARLDRFSGRHYRHAGRLLPLSRGGVALRAGEINTRLEGTDFDHHDNEVYLEVARDYLERVTRSGRFPDADALGDAERDAAEAHAEAVLAAIPALFD
jgi:pimeloyl-ACP methyl ester carboxylesterase